ncbi:MAG: class I SAM-dependent methyltransferase [Pontibacterium sp.]
MTASISSHYHRQLQSAQIISTLKARYPEGPDLYQLAPVDQLHIGGIKASVKLLKRLAELGGGNVLDIGSGLGGLMRLAQAEFDINLTGLDITHPLNEINHALSNLYNPDYQPNLITADAHQLPVRDQQYDVVLFQHSLLNMPDAAQVLRECTRVLKPAGAILMHEVIQGPQHADMAYPVPWARDAGHSHLRSQAMLEALITEAGFAPIQLSDWSQDALDWRKRQSEKEKQSHTKTQKPAVSPALILGPEFAQMGANVMKNLQSGAARVVEVVAHKQ